MTDQSLADRKVDGQQLATYSIWPWRRQLLWLAVVAACMLVFLLARGMAQAPTLGIAWRADSGAGMEIIEVDNPELQPLIGARVLALQCEAAGNASWSNRAMAPSARWVASDMQRATLQAARQTASRCIDSGHVNLSLQDGRQVLMDAQPRGYAALGAMFWFFCALASALLLTAAIVTLLSVHRVNVLYALMATAQAAQMLFFAVVSVPAVAPPHWLIGIEWPARMTLDLVTAAAMTHAVAIHPLRVRGHRWLAALAWAMPTLWLVGTATDRLSGTWWWGQGALLGLGAAALAVLSWSISAKPHPLTLNMRRLGWAIWVTLALVTLTVAAAPWLPATMQSVLDVSTVLWSVFVAAAVLMVPVTARAQGMLREFALVAGVGSVATSLELLFVAVASLSQRTSMTLSIVLALGLYAALRHWLLSRAMLHRTATTERMFEHLYRIAREVETRPERARERMSELLQHVFEPLQITMTEHPGKRSFVVHGGTSLLVPLPGLSSQASNAGMAALKYAERGQRLFQAEDALLADRILEQLMRAIAHDRALERGRTEERARIAQDLHDDIGARLLTLMYKAPNRDVENYVRHTLQDLKTLTRGLAAKSQTLSLAAAEWRNDAEHRLSTVHCALDWRTQIDIDVTLTTTEWSSLTRIVRELLNNVISHAQATHVQVDCDLSDGQLRLAVIDDGVGRQPQTWSHGLGLGGIRKRARQLAGSIAWTEQTPRGIRCDVVIPHLGQQPQA